MSESLTCPRCGEPFVCHSEKIETCACSAVRLSDDTRDYLENTDYGCLCVSCLGQLDRMVSRVRSVEFSPTAPLTEGVHYYLEDGLFVFTELYHIWKGYCCRKGCRHCAYGYNPT